MGTVYARGKVLWIKWKKADGKPKAMSTGYPVGEEERARRDVEKIEAAIRAGQVYGDAKGVTTLHSFGALWLQDRRELGLRDVDGDEGHLDNHVYGYKLDQKDGAGELGDMPIGKIRARHLADWAKSVRKADEIGWKTLRNVYGTVCALFRDAKIEGLVLEDPCVLTQHQLGERIERDSLEEEDSIYTRKEIGRLIGARELPADRRMLYALEFFGRMRLGEAAGVCWRHYEAQVEPLRRLKIARSYGNTTTKTGRGRYMPAHPVLAAMLAEWRLLWPAIFGREPTPEDLIVPAVREPGKGKRLAHGAMRTKSSVGKQFTKDLVLLGIPHRRGHDLGATFITLAEEDGANTDVLRQCTHTEKRKTSSAGAFDRYVRRRWPTFCAEVAKLKIERRAEPADVVALPVRAAANGVAQVPEKTTRAVTVELHPTATARDVYASRMEAPGIEPGRTPSAHGRHVAEPPDSPRNSTVQIDGLNGPQGAGCNRVTGLYRRPACASFPIGDNRGLRLVAAALRPEGSP